MSCKNSLSAALHEPGQRADALHVDELGGEGGVSRQLGQLLQGLQARVDAVGLDPLQELASRTGLVPYGKHIPTHYIRWIIYVYYIIGLHTICDRGFANHKDMVSKTSSW